MKRATKKSGVTSAAIPAKRVELVAKPGCCEEASIQSHEFYIPCNKPAENFVSYPRDKREYRMCAACTDHNVKNRGAVLLRKYDGPKPVADSTSSHRIKLSETKGGGELAAAVKKAGRDPIAELHSLRTLPVPASLLNEVDCARTFFETLIALTESTLPRLTADMVAANKRSVISLARAYVVLYKLNESVEAFDKAFSALFERYKKELIPAAFEQAGIPSLPLDEGMRVGTSYRTFASIRPDEKERAYAWLRKNYPDIIQPTVNSSTLSSLAKTMQEEDNLELPSDLFNVALVPTTSVTVAKK